MQDRAATASAADKESIAQETVRTAVVTTEARAAIVTQDRVATGRDDYLRKETVRAAVVTIEVRAVTVTADRRAQETGQGQGGQSRGPRQGGSRDDRPALSKMETKPTQKNVEKRVHPDKERNKFAKLDNGGGGQGKKNKERMQQRSLEKQAKPKKHNRPKPVVEEEEDILEDLPTPEPLQSLHRSQSQASASRSAFQPHRSSWRS